MVFRAINHARRGNVAEGSAYLDWLAMAQEMREDRLRARVLLSKNY